MFVLVGVDRSTPLIKKKLVTASVNLWFLLFLFYLVHDFWSNLVLLAADFWFKVECMISAVRYCQRRTRKIFIMLGYLFPLGPSIIHLQSTIIKHTNRLLAARRIQGEVIYIQ